MARFITFEGLDGSGKSTHLRRAAAWLAELGVPILQTHEPGGTPLGDTLRGIVLDPRWGGLDIRVEALLIFASRRQHLVEMIEPALADGRHVLCDRFTDSSFAYQGAGRELGEEWIIRLDALATDARRPDATLLFEVDPEIAFERRRQDKGGLDRIDAESLAFYRRVHDAFHELATRQPERFHRIDANGPKDATWSQVERALAALLELPVASRATSREDAP